MHIDQLSSSPSKISVPFLVMAGLREVVWHPGWVQAFTSVRAALDGGASVVLAGMPGLGRSLMLQALSRALREDGLTVVAIPGDSPEHGRQPDIVLLDEADRVPPALLRLLVSGAPNCVLVGSHALLATLDGIAAAPILVEMRPLSPDEVEAYLLEQIERVGLPASLLGPGTSEALAQHSQGNPRRLQQLASRALLRAWIDNADQMTAAHVVEAVAGDCAAEGIAGMDPLPRDEPLPQDAGDAGPVPHLGPLDTPPLSGKLAASSMRREPGSSRLRTRPWAAAAGAVVFSLGLTALITLPGSKIGRSPPPETMAPPSPMASLVPPALAPMPDASDPAPPRPPAAGPVAVVPHAAPPAPDRVILAPSPPALARPSATPVHVVVAFAPSDAAAGTRSVSLVGALKEVGMDAVLAVRLTTEQATSVRYFYAADESAAALVAQRMGESGRERLAAIHGIPPRPGTVQVVLSSRAASSRS